MTGQLQTDGLTGVQKRIPLYGIHGSTRHIYAPRQITEKFPQRITNQKTPHINVHNILLPYTTNSPPSPSSALATITPNLSPHQQLQAPVHGQKSLKKIICTNPQHRLVIPNLGNMERSKHNNTPQLSSNGYKSLQ